MFTKDHTVKNHRFIHAGRDLGNVSSPTPCSKKDQL